MSKTVTSNEGSKKKKDLLSKYPNKGLGPNCMIFEPGERQIKNSKGNIATIDLSLLDAMENVMTVPIVVGNIREKYDEIPVEKGNKSKEQRGKSAKSKAENKEKASKTTRKSGQRDSEEAR